MNNQPPNSSAVPQPQPDFSALSQPGPQAQQAPTQQAPTPDAQTAATEQPTQQGSTLSDVQNEFQAGQNELAEAQKIANQPAQPVATPGVYSGPHARLLNMVQGLSEGLSAFGTAIATHGREGGAKEVQEMQLQRQSAQMAAQRAAEEQKNEAISQKVNMAHAHMAQMQYQMALMKLPTELKEEALGLSNATVDSFTKLYDTAQQMGYDPDDPQQMQEARQRIGLDPTKSEGAITVPFSAGQSTAATSQAVQGALPPGKNLTDYSVFVRQNANAHGQGGQVVLLPTQGQLMQMPATPRQIAATQAESESMIQQARAAGLSDDPNSPNYNPQFAQFQGDYSTLKNVLANGGKPTSLQIHNLHLAAIGPLTTLVAGKTQAAKIQSEQQSAAVAGLPKNQQEAAGQLADAKSSGDANRIARAQANFDAITSTVQQERQFASQLQAQNLAANKQITFQNTLAQKGIEDTNKLWTDPQHGFSQTAAQIGATKDAIAQAKNGSELAASLEPAMVTLGVNSFAGVHRISPTEYEAAGPQVGSLYRRLNALLDKAGSGKVPQATLAEAQGIMDSLLQQKYNTSVASTRQIAANAGLPSNRIFIPSPSNYSQLTTLDKLGAPSTVQPNPSVSKPAAGMTRIKASDGTLHDVPTSNLGKARSIDPGLQVIQ